MYTFIIHNSSTCARLRQQLIIQVNALTQRLKKEEFRERLSKLLGHRTIQNEVDRRVQQRQHV